MLVFWPLEMGIIVYFDFGAMHYGVYFEFKYSTHLFDKLQL